MEFIKNLYTKAVISKFIDFLNEYYTLIIGSILFIIVIPIYFSNYSINYKIVASLYWFAAITAFRDARKDVKWLSFLILCVPFFIFLIYINTHGYEIWGKILKWQIARGIVIDLNPIFSKIPFNDSSFARIYKNETLTWFMRLVYNNGFVMTAIIPILRSGIAKDFKKMCKYLCSAHVFQIFLISPFYLMFHLQEVWFVLGHPDGLARNFTKIQAAGWTINCFPSMHTSISFAMFLLVLREKDKIFKWVWGFFCLSVIYSTMYLEIHWFIDVIAGLLLAYGTVKLVDFLFSKLEIPLKKYFSRFYYKSNFKNDNLVVKENDTVNM